MITFEKAGGERDADGSEDGRAGPCGGLDNNNKSLVFIFY